MSDMIQHQMTTVKLLFKLEEIKNSFVASLLVGADMRWITMNKWKKQSINQSIIRANNDSYISGNSNYCSFLM